MPIYAAADEAPAGAVRILLGTPSDFPDVSLPDAFDKLNDGGFVLRTEKDNGGRLLAIGKQPEAVQHAAVTLLRKLGCRWYYPAQSWHVIPQADTITVALDDTDQPSFIRRTIGYRSSDRGRFQQWAIYNRLGSTINGQIHHSYATFVPRSLFKEHPEYFALKDTDGDGIGDTRTPNQPCTTHPEVVKMFKERAIRAFENNPSLDMLPVSPNDGTGNLCRCERCRAVGSYSDCVWLLAHQVAEAVDQKFDGKKIAIMAYGRPSPPPTLDVPRDDRIVAELATAYMYHVSLDEMLKGWPKYVGLITIYDYWAIPQWGSNKPGGHFDVAEAKKDLPYYYRNNARGLTGEAAGSWGSTGLAIYVATQMMWDIDANVDAIVDRYYSDCFGKAADAVRAYESRWQRGAEFNDRTLKLALLDLQRGLNEAEHWPEKRRVAGLVLYMHALKVRRDFAQLGKKREKMSDEQIAQMIEAGDSFLWRFRDVGLYHMSIGIGAVTQDGFPWFTLDQIEHLLDEDLADLKDVPAIELKTTYSKDLAPLPASTPGVRVQADDDQGDASSSKARVLLDHTHVIIQADPQHPVQLQLRRSSNPSAPDHITAVLQPFSQDGKANDSSAPSEKQEVDFSKDGPYTMTLTPKTAGLYRIQFDGSNPPFSIESSQRWVLDLSRDARPKTWLSARNEPWYFYVPQGTKMFELFGGGGNKKPLHMQVFDAAGEAVADQTFEKSGRLQVRVPAEKQGTVWSFRMQYFISLYGNWIHGVPGYISPSPDRLLVPSEVLKDQHQQ